MERRSPFMRPTGSRSWGMNSVRPWRQQGGAIETSSSTASCQRSKACDRGRVAGGCAPSPSRRTALARSRKRPVHHRDLVMQRLVSAGVELVLSGHVHQSAVAERREFEVLRGSTRLDRSRNSRRLRRGHDRTAAERQSGSISTTSIRAASPSVRGHGQGSTFAEVGRRTFQRGQRDGANPCRPAAPSSDAQHRRPLKSLISKLTKDDSRDRCGHQPPASAKTRDRLKATLTHALDESILSRAPHGGGRRNADASAPRLVTCRPPERRHTRQQPASLMRQAGMPAELVAERLGHAGRWRNSQDLIPAASSVACASSASLRLG